MYDDFIDKIEVARELGASVLAAYYHFMRRHGVSLNDRESPVIKRLDELIELHESVYSAKDINELEQIMREFSDARSAIEERDKND